jgi:predicted PurR-regulated permease PerM
MWVFRTLLVVILIAVILGFSVYNAQERVAVSILNTRYINVPLIYIAYWAFLFGMVISFLLFVTIYFKQAAELRRQKRITDSLTHEIAALRNRTIQESGDSFLRSGKEESK